MRVFKKLLLICITGVAPLVIADGDAWEYGRGVDGNLTDRSKYYLRVEGGANFLSKNTGFDFKHKPVFGGALGYKFNNKLSFDVSLHHRSLDARKKSTLIKSDNYTGLVNANFYLMDNKDVMQIYLIGGVGVNHTKQQQHTRTYTVNANTVSIATTGKSKNNFAWNAGVGMQKNIYANIDASVTAKYIDLGKAALNTQIFTVNGSSRSIPFTKSVKQRGYEVTAGIVVNL